ncbi:MAG: outer membrane protein assembly factor BamC [Burkholderiales bacterium]|jgi:outer membrane protein assembly factor BamC|nr:outer membrane protein assembly factor BamC [Burkholderiales bacterium]
MRRALVPIALAAAALAGCTSFDDMFRSSKQIEYKSATKTSPLEVPPDLTRPGRDERYTVPDVNPSSSATLSTYNAERATQPKSGSVVLPDSGKVRMERSGNHRWLVVPDAAEKVWPVVREFWQDSGFVIVLENTDTGIMETDWAENRAKLPQDAIRNTLGKVLDSLYSTGERDKFRTRLERGPDGSTEIYITHRGMVEVLTGTTSSADTRWQPRPPDPELEAEFLQRLMVRIGVEENRAKTLVAQPSAKEDRAKLVPGAGGTSTLQVQEPFDRAWRRVGVALDRVGFTVEDRDRANGTYFVRYADPGNTQPKGQEGFFSKLAFWRSTDTGKQTEQYRVAVKGSGDTTEIVILNKNGAVDTSDTSRRILALLYDQLK